jgi:hypothetical protein
MNDELEPLSPELARLLESERGEDVVPPAASAQVLAGVFARTERTEGTGLAAAPKVSSPVPSAGSARVAQVGVVAFVAGALVGAWLQAQRAPSPVPQAVAPSASIAGRSDAPPAPPLPSPTASAGAPLEPPPEASAPRASLAPARASSTPGADTGDISGERRLIEQAQTALARGDGAAALEATSQHAARFPRGALVEEREYVAILALEQMGRTGDAARRGSKFLHAFPTSVFTPRVAALFDAGP